MPPAAELRPGYRHLCKHPCFCHLLHLHQRVSGENKDNISSVSSVFDVVRSIVILRGAFLELVGIFSIAPDFYVMYRSIHEAFAEPGPFESDIYHQTMVNTPGTERLLVGTAETFVANSTWLHGLRCSSLRLGFSSCPKTRRRSGSGSTGSRP